MGHLTLTSLTTSKMMSLYQPGFFLDSLFPSRAIQPQEGHPMFDETDTHWIVKIYLPDVSEEDFSTKIVDDNLEIHWTDLKRINHRGRVYESRESHHETLKLPSDVNTDEIESKFEKNFGLVRIPKPAPKSLAVKKQPSGQITPHDDPNTLMRMRIPKGDDDHLDVQIQGDMLTVTYDCSGKRTTGEGDDEQSVSFSNRIQKRTRIPEGIASSDLDTHVENGELIVRRKI